MPKTAQSIIEQIEQLAFEVRESSAEKIVNLLTGNEELFEDVFGEFWFEQSAIKLDALVINKVEEASLSRFQKEYAQLVSNLLFHLKRNYID